MERYHTWNVKKDQANNWHFMPPHNLLCALYGTLNDTFFFCINSFKQLKLPCTMVLTIIWLIDYLINRKLICYFLSVIKKNKTELAYWRIFIIPNFIIIGNCKGSFTFFFIFFDILYTKEQLINWENDQQINQ